MSQPTPVCTCGKPIEWIDTYCQECWEESCSNSWWEKVKLLTYKPMLIKITEPTYTIFFRPEDIIRIVPVFSQREIDYYRLELKHESQCIQLSPQQLDRLTPFLSYVDLSIDLDEPEQLTVPLDEDFDKTISELLDMAIKSPLPSPWLVLKK